jgi:hypothetical protein
MQKQIILPLKKIQLMKKYLLPAFAFLLIVANVSSVSPTRAQMHASTTVSTDAGATLPISVNIPEQWKTAIVREDGNGVVTFGLANENSAPFFLFSVTEIPDQLWGKPKCRFRMHRLSRRKTA